MDFNFLTSKSITTMDMAKNAPSLANRLKWPSCQYSPMIISYCFGSIFFSCCSSVPDGEKCIQASRLFASKPHMAGTPGDLATAKDFLGLLQTELGITPPSEEPIFPAGSSESQHATRSIPRSHRPSAWIDTYYPVMNTPLERSLQIVDQNGTSLWEGNLIETTDSTDPEAGKYFDDVPTFHGLSQGGDVTGHVVDGNYCTQEVRISFCVRRL